MIKNIKQKNTENSEIKRSQSASNGHENQNGYAILFTVIIVSAISVITAGLSNTAYKQLILSSLAKDSQAAFYQSDAATDCALYADQIMAMTDPTFTTVLNSWTCGGSSLRVIPISPDDGSGSYSIYPVDGDSIKPCFRINVKRTPVYDGNGIIIETKTEISARGYSMCNMENPRTVEREIQINY